MQHRQVKDRRSEILFHFLSRVSGRGEADGQKTLSINLAKSSLGGRHHILRTVIVIGYFRVSSHPATGNYRIRFDFAGSASGISVWDQILIGRISVVGSDSSGTVGMVGRDGRDSPCTAS